MAGEAGGLLDAWASSPGLVYTATESPPSGRAPWSRVIDQPDKQPPATGWW